MIGGKQTAALFVLGVALLLCLFWAGLSVSRKEGSPGMSQTDQSANRAPDVTPKPRASATPSTPEPVRTPERTGGRVWMVHVATFGTVEQADRLTAELRRKYLSARTNKPAPGDQDKLFRVLIGPYEHPEAEQVASELTAEGRKGVMIVQSQQQN